MPHHRLRSRPTSRTKDESPGSAQLRVEPSQINITTMATLWAEKSIVANATLCTKTLRLSYASPSQHSLSASSAGSCPAPVDVRSWPPIGTGVAACTAGASKWYISKGNMTERSIKRCVRLPTPCSAGSLRRASRRLWHDTGAVRESPSKPSRPRWVLDRNKLAMMMMELMNP